MSKRITEDNLQGVEEDAAKGEGELLRCEDVLSLVDELRRLRKLIVDSIPPYEFDEHALGREARAIREEGAPAARRVHVHRLIDRFVCWFTRRRPCA